MPYRVLPKCRLPIFCYHKGKRVQRCKLSRNTVLIDLAEGVGTLEGASRFKSPLETPTWYIIGWLIAPPICTSEVGWVGGVPSRIPVSLLATSWKKSKKAAEGAVAVAVVCRGEKNSYIPGTYIRGYARIAVWYVWRNKKIGEAITDHQHLGRGKWWRRRFSDEIFQRDLLVLLVMKRSLVSVLYYTDFERLVSCLRYWGLCDIEEWLRAWTGLRHVSNINSKIYLVRKKRFYVRCVFYSVVVDILRDTRRRAFFFPRPNQTFIL